MQRSIRYIGVTALMLVAILCLALILLSVTYAQATVTRPPLGTAGSFAVLGGSTVKNTGPSVLNGNLGVDPGSAITGFPPGLVHGATHKADAVALAAQGDVTIAYNAAKGAPCAHDMTSQDLGSKSLVAGVYCFSSSAQLTGPLTLDGPGVYIFQVGSKFTTSGNAVVTPIQGASPCNVFWQVGSSATIGTDSRFVGNILALTSISAQTGATFNGGLYARNGAVHLDNNTVTRSRCSTVPTKTPTPGKTPTSGPGKTPTPGPAKTPTPFIVPKVTPTAEVGLG
jgi:Ice-binding-like